MIIAENLKNFQKRVPKNVRVVAVSKTKPIQAITEAYQAGQRVFGENKVQELAQKYNALPKDIRWHFIGHLQKNKVKYLAGFVDLIHGVDKVSCLEEINKQGLKHERIIHCLLQIKIAQETTKYGMHFEEVEEILERKILEKLHAVKIVGLMGMATFTQNKIQIQNEFQSLQYFFEKHKKQQKWNTLSMGMSGDYELAIQKGSTMIRIGSAIFGERENVTTK